ncbi:ARGINYL tRNA SYNTHETASE [Encephalitozoon cuniculi GB-M1]|uniref:Arginine--tRNA ligase n=2 Tax=Encephalitozoon cuniculi TaxID=6035 RepID=SYR_ENCCU|nr:arginyl-tRNA synthetase [Encephalitozoon cuniculi GB-M1]Q8SRD8.1 RecName: Full=Arginine--tRNA ligase; AltName: Full=Arginyl-tRNA synthetase; Short=ArgRS [Encephalitozoon cuniculi GB-M1]AGE95033.1 arginyl tRNA synthetase [Encephalitozoon cuniculi]KMV65583.1 arginyl-tRNA synthetase [Encephalitozoon cuniculi EcunIII-L]UYI26983.1 arginyl-tRNA synthetase [Encephalitozoon cuniculi]CAD26360.1 ARGINYL tRNA SYNTHETASE [Encephalitozoon cuniculi GB-M1]
MFNELFRKVVEAISKASKFTPEEIAACMERSYQPKKPNVTLFLDRISPSPQEDAKELLETLAGANIELIENLAIRKSSVCCDINKRAILKDVLGYIQKNREIFGNNNVGKGKRMVVEYSSPNIAKIFHIGHLRTTVLGQFIVNLLRASGYETTSINYFGDWGKQFGFVLLGYSKYGSEEELEKDPLKHLFNVYVKISADAEKNPDVDSEAKEIFRMMEEDKDEWCMNLWRRFRELSIEKYKVLYKRLNVEFDVYSGESMYNEKGKSIVETSKQIKTDEDGSKVFDLGKAGKVLVMKNDGTTLYITRDIAAAIERLEEYSPEKIIYVVSSEQNKHFEDLFGVLEMLGYDKDKFQHVSYGLVAGMSTRAGKVQLLEDIIQESTEVMKNVMMSDNNKGSFTAAEMDQTAEVLAISTLLVMDFTARRVKGYEFDIEKRARNTSGTGLYLQYAHCRLRSIETKNSNVDYNDIETIDFELIHVPKVLNLVYKLLWFEHVVEKCLEDYEPSRIVTYLQDLASSINGAINILRVLGVDKELARARLLVLSSARIVLHNGLRILGATPLNKM